MDEPAKKLYRPEPDDQEYTKAVYCKDCKHHHGTHGYEESWRCYAPEIVTINPQTGKKAGKLCRVIKEGDTCKHFIDGRAEWEEERLHNIEIARRHNIGEIKAFAWMLVFVLSLAMTCIYLGG